mgnify:FL=1
MARNQVNSNYIACVKMAEQEKTYHVPVLLNESIEGLNIGDGEGCFVDVTFGGGGHSKEILARLSVGGHLYSFDQDADAEKNAERLVGG